MGKSRLRIGKHAVIEIDLLRTRIRLLQIVETILEEEGEDPIQGVLRVQALRLLIDPLQAMSRRGIQVILAHVAIVLDLIRVIQDPMTATLGPVREIVPRQDLDLQRIILLKKLKPR